MWSLELFVKPFCCSISALSVSSFIVSKFLINSKMAQNFPKTASFLPNFFQNRYFTIPKNGWKEKERTLKADKYRFILD
jgi:hypothetical protein